MTSRMAVCYAGRFRALAIASGLVRDVQQDVQRAGIAIRSSSDVVPARRDRSTRTARDHGVVSRCAAWRWPRCCLDRRFRRRASMARAGSNRHSGLVRRTLTRRLRRRSQRMRWLARAGRRAPRGVRSSCNSCGLPPPPVPFLGAHRRPQRARLLACWGGGTSRWSRPSTPRRRHASSRHRLHVYDGESGDPPSRECEARERTRGEPTRRVRVEPAVSASAAARANAVVSRRPTRS